MRFSPEFPTTNDLELLHPLSDEAASKVEQKRRDVNRALRLGRAFVAIVGPCAMTGDTEATLDENRRISTFGEQENITTLHRAPVWKPRTNPADWHGLETTSPEIAHYTATKIAEQNGNLAIEIGHSSHIQRYISRTALGWRGSRNDGDTGLLESLRDSGELIPFGIKNGMSGHIDGALSEIEVLNQSLEAPTILIFRGGESFASKDSWIRHYHEVLERTNGNVIIDLAHGSEQAHDINGEFKKSALGQLACIDSIISVAGSTGRTPRGIMIEASDITSPTDPVVPLDEALAAVKRLAHTSQQMQRENLDVAAD